ncbi:MAG: radical SAM protein [Verrucomicrobia bacterium]|nr:radical SAM protein [Verrucomicrobiota bacterium]MCG2681722.1 radical SAM protein [Kiritimatiellia bacterium]MBU4247183.1 radical SAM protein [Verrucomicrobiota bacterium]MBU4291402.1 radical SAM protein [Verrucomicrobiota bacterium]MBU4428570.1 radical SAM protein [Verrucomicrobiota bacterium]
MKLTVIFLELPLLDNDADGHGEHLRLAGVYLRSVLERSAERRYFKACFLPEHAYALDDRRLVQRLEKLRPDVVACTLYLWNIERSLRVLNETRRRLPRVRIVVGGPEVARDHPFLFRSRIPDVAVAGEGETVFPAILHGLRTGRRMLAQSVAWKTSRGYRWGTRAIPVRTLSQSLPAPACSYYRPDVRGMAYLEASRGCPRHCVYCRYHHLRQGVSFLKPEAIARRVAALLRKGAQEIRLMDPAFNAHPAFEEVLRRLAAINVSGSLRFFAEVNADVLTREQARLLARANFTEIEIGVQSRNPRVLRRIGRPTDLQALDRGIGRLLAEGIRVTVDLMVGLPGQALRDVRESSAWAARLKGVRVQCLQTLLLPGTDLRACRKRWRLAASGRPPYAVTASAALPARDMRRALAIVRRRIGRLTDCPTRALIGRSLPDLFPERIHLIVPGNKDFRGIQSRRALIFHSADLYAYRKDILSILRMAVREEPHALWQFVLAPEWEEPLDLIDTLVDALRQYTPHLNDRWIALDAGGRRAARRVMVWLGRRRYDASWVATADALLRKAFY